MICHNGLQCSDQLRACLPGSRDDVYILNPLYDIVIAIKALFGDIAQRIDRMGEPTILVIGVARGAGGEVYTLRAIRAWPKDRKRRQHRGIGNRGGDGDGLAVTRFGNTVASSVITDFADATQCINGIVRSSGCIVGKARGVVGRIKTGGNLAGQIILIAGGELERAIRVQRFSQAAIEAVVGKRGDALRTRACGFHQTHHIIKIVVGIFSTQRKRAGLGCAVRPGRRIDHTGFDAAACIEFGFGPDAVRAFFPNFAAGAIKTVLGLQVYAARIGLSRQHPIAGIIGQPGDDAAFVYLDQIAGQIIIVVTDQIGLVEPFYLLHQLTVEVVPIAGDMAFPATHRYHFTLRVALGGDANPFGGGDRGFSGAAVVGITRAIAVGIGGAVDPPKGIIGRQARGTGGVCHTDHAPSGIVTGLADAAERIDLFDQAAKGVVAEFGNGSGLVPAEAQCTALVVFAGFVQPGIAVGAYRLHPLHFTEGVVNVCDDHAQRITNLTQDPLVIEVTLGFLVTTGIGQRRQLLPQRGAHHPAGQRCQDRAGKTVRVAQRGRDVRSVSSIVKLFGLAICVDGQDDPIYSIVIEIRFTAIAIGAADATARRVIAIGHGTSFVDAVGCFTAQLNQQIALRIVTPLLGALVCATCCSDLLGEIASHVVGVGGHGIERLPLFTHHAVEVVVCPDSELVFAVGGRQGIDQSRRIAIPGHMHVMKLCLLVARYIVAVLCQCAARINHPNQLTTAVVEVVGRLIGCIGNRADLCQSTRLLQRRCGELGIA
ncbi:hypothetical protein IGB42_03943 [Andreprevotia sp. IGB-42]|nr:hypothetical protein IGB42_03943 [Andreprevotia sp. IGB-42]